MNFERMCQDFNIPYQTEGHKHCRPGWVNVECPFCSGNSGLHLGYEEDTDRFVCWRCGWKAREQAIGELLRIPKSQAREVVRKYQGKRARSTELKAPQIRVDRCTLPYGSAPLGRLHRRYLEGRKFDPVLLVDLWGLQGTGPHGDYRFRIIAPITEEGSLLSYQGRDVTGKHSLKYMACAAANEVKDHKDSLYGIDQVPGSSVVICEGITDVWRMGPGAVATFGIKFKMAQVGLLRRFREHFILYDDDFQAIKQARKLGNLLSGFSDNVEILSIKKDPGSLTQSKADKIMKTVGIR